MPILVSRALLSVATLALAASCGGFQEQVAYQTNTSQAARFGEYRTVAFVGQRDVPGFERLEIPEAAREDALAAARETLEERGYSIAPAEEADLLFRAGVGRRTRTETSRGVSGNTACGLAYDCYQEVIDEATLVIDAYDRENERHVWQGVATGSMPSEGSGSRALRNAVRGLLEQLPTASGF